MGSYGDRWLACEWCWKWGKCLADEHLGGAMPLTDIDGLGVLCYACMVLEEPPWRPNNRQRCATWLERMRLLPEALLVRSVIVVSMATYIARNTP